MTDKLFKVKLPLQEIRFSGTDVLFVFENIKSRYPSVVYFNLYCYDMNQNLIGEYSSVREIVTSEFQTVLLPLQLASNSRIAYTEIELVFDGLDGENPCFFNGLMFQEGTVDDYDGYHRPYELQDDSLIELLNNLYVCLYKEDSYLQVIRPNKDKFHSNMLDKSECTVLAPHFRDDEDVDDAVSVFYEFANQTEQSIDIMR